MIIKRDLDIVSLLLLPWLRIFASTPAFTVVTSRPYLRVNHSFIIYKKVVVALSDIYLHPLLTRPILVHVDQHYLTSSFPRE